jgi:hypothetical protein
MKEMVDLSPEDIYSIFIIIDKSTKNRQNILYRYCGRTDVFGENCQLTHQIYCTPYSFTI